MSVGSPVIVPTVIVPQRRIAVDWSWWLCKSSDMSQISQLNAHDRQLQLQLNSQGKAQCWLHLLDPVTASVVEHQTALRCDRNGKTVFSAPIFQATETSQSGTGSQKGQDQLQLTAMGWFQNLNQRIIHTGAEFQSMLTAPNGVAWQAANGAYVSPGTDSATQLAYSATLTPSTTDAVILTDLLNRANIDAPTLITMGNVYGNPIQRNLTLQRFQGVGQQMVQLANVESGCDIYVDPVTRKMHLFGPGASSSPSITSGMGVDRGTGVVFSYPGNCTMAKRTKDGTQTANRIEAIGQYAVGRADDLDSQQSNGLFEAQDALSEVVDTNILIAFANVEVAVRKNPWTIITFTPRAVQSADATISGVPRPFDDYFLGDVVYTVIDRGPRFKVGSSANPQPTRVFGFGLSIDDDGVERMSSLSTTYQGLGSG